MIGMVKIFRYATIWVKMAKNVFFCDFPNSVIQNPYLMAEFQKSDRLPHFPRFKFPKILHTYPLGHTPSNYHSEKPGPPLDFDGHLHVRRRALLGPQKCARFMIFCSYTNF